MLGSFSNAILNTFRNFCCCLCWIAKPHMLKLDYIVSDTDEAQNSSFWCMRPLSVCFHSPLIGTCSLLTLPNLGLSFCNFGPFFFFLWEYHKLYSFFYTMQYFHNIMKLRYYRDISKWWQPLNFKGVIKVMPTNRPSAQWEQWCAALHPFQLNLS